jgi:hypothetical protein
MTCPWANHHRRHHPFNSPEQPLGSTDQETKAWAYIHEVHAVSGETRNAQNVVVVFDNIHASLRLAALASVERALD